MAKRVLKRRHSKNPLPMEMGRKLVESKALLENDNGSSKENT